MKIEEAKKKLKYMADFARDVCIKQNEAEAIETVLAELEKKDKIIDALAYEMSEEDENFQFLHTSEIIEYFEKKVREENE